MRSTVAPVAGDAMHAPSPQYVPVAELLAGTAEIPQRLDAATIRYRGVTCHVYGVLHGLAGFDESAVDPKVRDMVDNVRWRAIELARAPRRPSRLRFVLASLAGASIPLSLYFGLGTWLWARS